MATQQYYFDIDVNGFPLLTEHNIEFIKALVKNDPGYRQPIDNDYKIILKGQMTIYARDGEPEDHSAKEGKRKRFRNVNVGNCIIFTESFKEIQRISVSEEGGFLFRILTGRGTGIIQAENLNMEV